MISRTNTWDIGDAIAHLRELVERAGRRPQLMDSLRRHDRKSVGNGPTERSPAFSRL